MGIHTEVNMLSIENVNGFTSQSQSTISASTKNEGLEKSQAVSAEAKKTNNETKENVAKLVDENKIKNAIEMANQKMKVQRTNCEFSYHEKTKRVLIKVVDNETKEIIKEIPPEKTLDMIEKIWELAGILLDEKR